MKIHPFFVSAFVWLAVVMNAGGWERVFDFEKDVENLPPEGMVVETAPDGKPIVTVQNDPDASPKSRFLAMRGSPFPGINSLLCLAWFSNVKNGSICARLKHGGEEKAARTAGLVWRYQSLMDTYTLEWDTKKSALALAVLVKGQRKILGKKRMPLPANQWATLSVDFHDSNIQCKVDDKPVLNFKDSTLMEAGKVGLLLQSDVTMYFDNFRICGDD